MAYHGTQILWVVLLFMAVLSQHCCVCARPTVQPASPALPFQHARRAQPQSDPGRASRVQKLLVFNHPSWVDSVLLLAFFAPSGVSREANLRIPVIGLIIRSFQNIYTHSRPAASDAAAAPLAPPSTTEQIARRCAPTVAEGACMLCAVRHALRAGMRGESPVTHVGGFHTENTAVETTKRAAASRAGMRRGGCDVGASTVEGLVVVKHACGPLQAASAVPSRLGVQWRARGCMNAQ